VADIHSQKFRIQLKQGTEANIHATATENLAVQGEPHYTTDTYNLFIFDGTQNLPVQSRLASVNVDMKTAASTTLYTVPASKTLYITRVIIRNPSASMAGGTDYDFTNWKQTVDLSSLTTLGTDYIVLDGNNTKYAELAAAATFQITVNTGTTAACTADVDVFGYLV